MPINEIKMMAYVIVILSSDSGWSNVHQMRQNTRILMHFSSH